MDQHRVAGLDAARDKTGGERADAVVEFAVAPERAAGASNGAQTMNG